MQGPPHVDAETVKRHARDLKSLLEEADRGMAKSFLRSFVKRIEIRENEAVIEYTLPIPSNGHRTDTLSVLPIVTPGGAEVTIGRTLRRSP